MSSMMQFVFMIMALLAMMSLTFASHHHQVQEENSENIFDHAEDFLNGLFNGGE